MDWFERKVDVWDSNPILKTDRSKEYLIDVSNLLGTANRMGKYEMYENYIKKIESINPKDLDEKVEQFQNVEYLRILWCMNTMQWDVIKEKLDQINRKFKRYEKRMVASRKITMCYNICILYFAFGNYNRSMDWARTINNDNSKDTNPYNRLKARIFEIINLYKLKDYALARSYVVNRKKGIDKGEHEFEKFVLLEVRKLIKIQQSAPLGKKKRLKEHYNHMHEQALILKNKLGKNFSFIEEIIVWLKSEIYEIPFTEALEKHIKKEIT